MAVTAVKLEMDAFMVCLTHALSTEREEVMGLLIGEVTSSTHNVKILKKRFVSLTRLYFTQ